MLVFLGIYENAEKNPYKICMTLGENKIRYCELIKKINKRAIFLAKRYKKGENVIVKNENPINMMINFLACARAGLVSICVDSKLLKSTIKKIVQKVNPCLIIDDKFYEYDDLNCHEYAKDNFKLKDVKDSDIFMGALSSGTTGHNKVIWRDHKSWASAFKYQSKMFNITYKDVLFLVGSLSYTANLNSAVHILNEGGSIVFSKSIYPRTWISEMKNNNVSSIFMVPAHYRILVKKINENMEEIKSVLSAGDKLDSETVNVLKKKFPKASICEYYGASELGHVSYINFRENFNINSVGKAFPKVKFFIKDDLVWVKSPYIAPDFRSVATVGDMGKIDEEGNLYLLGRKNQTINKGGVKILPYSIECVLNAHPQILKSVVFGIAHKLKGEEICAIIVSKSNKLTISQVMDYCKEKLDIQNRPQNIKIIENIKLNISGKIDRKGLIKTFLDV